ncbi:MAG: efflux transporter periplasmic adaptor subunit [Fluviicola sp.]|nr:MAG: efflux transporter periplasmic adaptor subunit [Fluviicola sp.]
MKKHIIIPIAAGILGLLIGLFFMGSGDKNPAKETAEQSDEVWTCSMHPHVRKNEPGQCPICGMDLIPASSSGSNPLVFEMTPDAVRIANIQTTVVGYSGDSEGSLSLSGKIVADETASSSVVSHIPGRIEKLYIGFTGERVSRGQRIAKIYSPNYISAQRELLEAFKVRDINPGLLEAAKNKLRYWKISNKEIDGIIKNKRINEYVDIRSDYSGVVHRKLVSVGDHLGQGQALFELQNLTNLWAVFDVYESQLNLVKIGDRVTFTTPALLGQEFSSTISFIDPIVNSSSRTTGVRMEIKNSKNQLKPDMFINGVLIGKQSENELLTIPKTAVLWTGERSVVYVKVPNMSTPSFEFREVTLGRSTGDRYEILDGIKSGEEVVTNGAFVIDASAQLNNQASMMNRTLLKSEKQKLGKTIVNFESNDPFKAQLSKVMNQYILLKDALVQDNSKMSIQHAKDLLSALQNVDMKLVKGDAHMFWMKRQQQLKKASESIIAIDKIIDQRVAFDKLSQSMIEVATAFGAFSNDLYVQECTMAFNGKGANWLSQEHEILNPFYGSQMISCGSVIDTIKKENNNKRTDHSGHVH